MGRHGSRAEQSCLEDADQGELQLFAGRGARRLLRPGAELEALVTVSDELEGWQIVEQRLYRRATVQRS